jgi:hypothetical protein
MGMVMVMVKLVETATVLVIIALATQFPAEYLGRRGLLCQMIGDNHPAPFFIANLWYQSLIPVTFTLTLLIFIILQSATRAEKPHDPPEAIHILTKTLYSYVGYMVLDAQVVKMTIGLIVT